MIPFFFLQVEPRGKEGVPEASEDFLEDDDGGEVLEAVLIAEGRESVAEGVLADDDSNEEGGEGEEEVSNEAKKSFRVVRPGLKRGGQNSSGTEAPVRVSKPKAWAMVKAPAAGPSHKKEAEISPGPKPKQRSAAL